MDGDELRRLRARYGLTQVAVARAAGMRQPDLSAIEHDRRGSSDMRERVLAAIRSLVKPSDGLNEETRTAMREVFERCGAGSVRIFGSVARGADKPGSDLDLIAQFPPGFDLFDLFAMEADLERLLGLPVDVVSDDPRTASSLTRARREAVAL